MVKKKRNRKLKIFLRARSNDGSLKRFFIASNSESLRELSSCRGNSHEMSIITQHSSLPIRSFSKDPFLEAQNQWIFSNIEQIKCSAISSAKSRCKQNITAEVSPLGGGTAVVFSEEMLRDEGSNKNELHCTDRHWNVKLGIAVFPRCSVYMTKYEWTFWIVGKFFLQKELLLNQLFAFPRRPGGWKPKN